MLSVHAIILGLLGPAIAGGDSQLRSSSLSCPFGSYSPALAAAPGLAAVGSSICLVRQSSPPAETRHVTIGYDRSEDPSWVQTGTCHRLREGKACVFTQPRFNAGAGISIITTKERLTEISHRFTSSAAAGESKENEPLRIPKRYKEEEMPGKGIGLVATQPIRTGSRIMARSAAVMVDDRALRALATNELTELLVLAVQTLPSHHRLQFLNLSTHEGANSYADQVYKIFTTNAYRTSVDGGSDFHSTFVEMSRMNHDCQPNSAYYFDPETMAQRVYAVRDIMPGEELTVSYTDPIQPSATRQRHLRTDWGFSCSCQRCKGDDYVIAESDDRVKQIKQLWVELDDYSESSNATAGKAELLVTLFELEGLGGRIQEAYYRTALEYNGLGDAGLAVRYARLCLDRGLLLRGPSQPFIKSMKELVRSPEDHWSWKFRVGKPSME